MRSVSALLSFNPGFTCTSQLYVATQLLFSFNTNIAVIVSPPSSDRMSELQVLLHRLVFTVVETLIPYCSSALATLHICSNGRCLVNFWKPPHATRLSLP